MSIFKTKDPAPEPVVTGIDVLRQTVKARDHKAGALKAIASGIDGIGMSNLEAFINGGDLKVETLQALAKVLYDGSEYDPESGLLRSANKTPPKTYVHPPRWDPKSHPYYVAPREPGAYYPPPKPVKPVPTKPQGPRPGWADGWT